MRSCFFLGIFLNYISIGNKIMKSSQMASTKFRNLLNNSTSKEQYSFPKNQRFHSKFNSEVITTNIGFYDTGSKLSTRTTTFGSSQRRGFPVKQGPGPDSYTLKGSLLATGGNLGVSRSVSNQLQQEAKAVTVFRENTNPGPGQYNPQRKRHKTGYTIGNQQARPCKTQQSSPGPIYNVKSTITEKDQVLSTYLKKPAPKIIMQSRKVSDQQQKIKEVREKINQRLQCFYYYDKQMFNRRGARPFGRNNRQYSIARSQRFKHDKKPQQSPGPGAYQTFSQFIDLKE